MPSGSHFTLLTPWPQRKPCCALQPVLPDGVPAVVRVNIRLTRSDVDPCRSCSTAFLAFGTDYARASTQDANDTGKIGDHFQGGQQDRTLPDLACLHSGGTAQRTACFREADSLFGIRFPVVSRERMFLSRENDCSIQLLSCNGMDSSMCSRADIDSSTTDQMMIQDLTGILPFFPCPETLAEQELENSLLVHCCKDDLVPW